MHTSKDELEPMAFGEYEGRTIDSGEMRIAFESMPTHKDAPEEIVGAGEAYHQNVGLVAS